MVVQAQQKNMTQEKSVEIHTVGNVPNPCPSKPVWVATPGSERTTRPPFSVASLLDESSLVIDGTVQGLEFCPAVVKGSTTFTFVTLKVNEVISGHYAGSVITIPMAGGLMDGFLGSFSNNPLFKRGERQILFLRGGRVFPVAEGTQGAFLIQENGSVTTYYGQPVVKINPKSGTYLIDPFGGPSFKTFDPIYGPLKLVRGPDSEPRRLISGTGHREASIPSLGEVQTAMRVENFIRSLKEIQVSQQIEPGPDGSLLSPGTPFQFGPLKTVPFQGVSNEN